MSILVTILQIFAGILGVIFLFAVLPWKISIDGNVILRNSSFSGNGKIKLGSNQFGIAASFPRSFHFGPFVKPWYSFTIKTKNKAKTKTAKKETSRKQSPMPYIRSTLNTLRWEQVSLIGNFGLKNPADTGIIFGGIQAFKGLVRTKKIRLDVTPVFTHRLDTDLTGSVRIKCIPARLAWNLTKTYLHFRSKKG